MYKISSVVYLSLPILRKIKTHKQPVFKEYLQSGKQQNLKLDVEDDDRLDYIKMVNEGKT